MLKVTIYKDRRGEFRWRVKGGSRIVADSGEGYTRKHDAARAWSRFFSGILTLALKDGPTKPAKRRGRR